MQENPTTTNIYSQFLWVRNSSTASLDACGSESLIRLQSSGQPGLQSSQSLTERWATFKLTHVATGSPQVLTAFWPGTSVPCHLDLSTGHLTTWSCLPLGQMKEERILETEAKSFCNLVSVITSATFYSSEVSPALIQGERIINDCEH